MFSVFKKLYHKAFTGGKWIVAVRQIDGNDPVFAVVKANEGQWLADPFLFEDGPDHYLFVEQYFKNKNRAGIGVYSITDEGVVDNHVIIDNPYHMSYPCVFRYGEKYFMVPESSSNSSLDLYEATQFPYRWEIVSHLLTGTSIVDSTVIVDNGIVYILGYMKNSAGPGFLLIKYILDMNSYSIKEISRKEYKDNVARPAGGFFYENGILYRPAQNCSLKYGNSIIFYRVDSLKNNQYSEMSDSEMFAGDINCSVPITRVHTYNRDSKYEVIDGFIEQFDILHWYKILKRRHRK